ncbi:MAG: hypothetical protein HYR63_28995 [Proteobacteria bacterium]|nr:hypothetical protein [Pseudomonadota bacterium]
MRYVLFLAGFEVEVYQRLSSVSSKKFVPNGHLILKPNLTPFGYLSDEASKFLVDAFEHILPMNEAEPISLLLAYVDFGDQSTRRFVREFFPFCVTMPIEPFEARGTHNRPQWNAALARYVQDVIRASRKLLDVANVVRAHTSGNNLTPLLLPIRNFYDGRLGQLFEELFFRLAVASDPSGELAKSIAAILNAHPWAHPPGEKQRCLSDGVLFFGSSGSCVGDFGNFRASAACKSAPSV